MSRRVANHPERSKARRPKGLRGDDPFLAREQERYGAETEGGVGISHVPARA